MPGGNPGKQESLITRAQKFRAYKETINQMNTGSKNDNMR
jgi:hypothetical protein